MAPRETTEEAKKPRTCCAVHHHQDACPGQQFGWEMPGFDEADRRLACGCGYRPDVHDCTHVSTPAPEEARLRGHGLTYMHVFADLRDAARGCGYALAVHGSLDRDLDVVAVPWTEEATDAETLVTAICAAWKFGDGLMQKAGDPERKPHGRVTWSLIPGGPVFVDLSVMPLSAPAPARAEPSEAMLAIEAAVRKHLCPIEDRDGDDGALYVCLGEDGDAIIEAETIPEVIAQVSAVWDRVQARLEAVRRGANAEAVLAWAYRNPIQRQTMLPGFPFETEEQYVARYRTEQAALAAARKGEG